MLRVKLFCALGFSTGMLVKNMNKAAEDRGVDLEIEACGQGKMQDSMDNTDVALLSPQLAYTKASAEEVFGKVNVPVAVIPMADYGKLDGEKVLDLVLSLVD